MNGADAVDSPEGAANRTWSRQGHAAARVGDGDAAVTNRFPLPTGRSCALLLATLACSTAFGVVLSGLSGHQPSSGRRVLRFDSNVPIAQRLLDDDTIVTIEMPPGDLIGLPTTRETYLQEISRMGGSEEIVVAEASVNESTVVDNGTWIRTRVGFRTVQIVRSSANIERQSGWVEAWHEGGSVRIGGVQVVAEATQRFTPGDRYLLFLASDRGRGIFMVSHSFRVNSDGVLENSVKGNLAGGSRQSNFIGRLLADVSDALGRVQ